MSQLPLLSPIWFGLRDGKANLMDSYAKHTARETQLRDDRYSLTQLRDWKRTGVEDLSLIELLVVWNDSEPINPGQDQGLSTARL